MLSGQAPQFFPLLVITAALSNSHVVASDTFHQIPIDNRPLPPAILHQELDKLWNDGSGAAYFFLEAS